MKLLTNKGIVQKIIIAIIIVMVFNFIMPTISSAASLNSVGGLLIEPFTELVSVVCDTILAGLQNFLYNGVWDVKRRHI